MGGKGEEEKLRNLIRAVGGRKQLEFNFGFFLPICGLTQLLVVPSSLISEMNSIIVLAL